jgi:hypothetical protein
VSNLKGLLLHVYRQADPLFPDCSNGGVSAKHNRLIVVGTKRHDEDMKPLPRESQVFSPSDEAPAVVLVESGVPGLYGPHLEPLEYVDAHNTKAYAGPMAGGNYAGTCDSRWAALGRDVFGHDRLDIVAVHDRFESWDQYYALST